MWSCRGAAQPGDGCPESFLRSSQRVVYRLGDKRRLIRALHVERERGLHQPDPHRSDRVYSGAYVMTHPNFHAISSAKKFGGRPEDYLHIHQWLDATKETFADFRHRAL